MIIVYVPCKDDAEAKKIAKTLLSEKLIACANLIPSVSIYEWEGSVKEDTETIILAKTLEIKEDEVRKRIEELHSYDIPAIIKLDSETNEEYLAWVQNCMS